MLRRTNHQLVRVTDEDYAEHLLAELEASPPEQRVKEIADWLEHERPDHPLVGTLAETEEPALRLLAPRVLKAHPTPENRATLDRLLQDPDEPVRDAAEEAHQKQKELAARPPAYFAMPPPEIPATD